MSAFTVARFDWYPSCVAMVMTFFRSQGLRDARRMIDPTVLATSVSFDFLDYRHKSLGIWDVDWLVI
jgi:hypothetical protein